MLSRKKVSEDEFRMWRALFAFALVDGVLSVEEQNILAHHIQNNAFTEAQLKTLRADMKTPKDVEELFSAIEDKKNHKQFCALARTLVWSGGDIDLQEKKILQHVGCFETREFKGLLKDSVKAKLYTSFVEMYEKTGGFSKTARTPLFQMAA